MGKKELKLLSEQSVTLLTHIHGIKEFIENMKDYSSKKELINVLDNLQKKLAVSIKKEKEYAK